MRGAGAVFVSVGLLGVVACESPSPSLTGTWVPIQQLQVTNLSGAWTALHLTDAGGEITGRLVWGGFLGAAPESTAVAGSRSGMSFRLAFTAPTGLQATYSGRIGGRFVDPDNLASTALEGTWVEGPDSATAVWVRDATR